MLARLSHLDRLEAESIHIFREVAATFNNPVMLYSVGKDSSVLLHLAMKAFYPAKPPFPFLHVDTTWKFKAMYEMRERMARAFRERPGMPEAIAAIGGGATLGLPNAFFVVLGEIGRAHV